ncbi:MAG: alpha-1,2-fucosyltransferase, partial [Candidatus Paceibacterota bacterium]
MIIIKLKGGLGNQMFQYALGRKLSLKTGEEFQLDKTDYENDTFRSYGLGVFNVIENFAKAEEVARLDPNRKEKTLINKLKRIIEFKILKNYHVGWEPNFLKKILDKIKKGEDVYLDGYWQSYKYIDDIRGTLAKDFSLKPPLEETHQEFLNKINSTNSVAVSFRRTDYLLPQNLKTIGICSANYYNKAIELMAT